MSRDHLIVCGRFNALGVLTDEMLGHAPFGYAEAALIYFKKFGTKQYTKR